MCLRVWYLGEITGNIAKATKRYQLRYVQLKPALNVEVIEVCITEADDTVSYTDTNLLRAPLTAALPHASPWEQSDAYDEGQRLTGFTSPAGSFGYSYLTNRQSLVQALILPNGARTNNAFDSLARLTGPYLRNSQGTASSWRSSLKDWCDSTADGGKMR
jgi:hypothetical protein